MWRSAASAVVVAGALLAAGCGASSQAAQSESPTTCLLRLEATARADTIISLYNQGKLGSRRSLERWARTRIPFLDESGRVIPYDRMTERQALRMDAFAIKASSRSAAVLIEVRDAVAEARHQAKTRCR